MSLKVILGEISGTNLLGDTAGLISLDICLSKLVEDEGLSRVDVTHDTNNWAAQFLCTFGLLLGLSCGKKGELAGSSVVSAISVENCARLSSTLVFVGTLLLLATFLSHSFDLFFLAFVGFLFVGGELLVLTHGNGDVLALSFLSQRLCHILDRIFPVVELGLIVLGYGSVLLGRGRRRFALLHIIDCRGGGVGFHSGVSRSTFSFIRLSIAISSALLTFVLLFVLDDLATLGRIRVIVSLSS